ncbi:hypothetical protein HG717_00240 [Rhodococcus erythropolis]|uniref:hypothetical protein n=1 Tax=Rhodococcus erythropolis TaxID=1833 RepID=UPI001C9AFDC5|nr:hypothetical protein [Rhodococcus erythropolis]MBY6382367.1 hypothetical protein [Rhodococcus erythropolis]
MRLPAEQLVFGWATKTLERHGTGNGVLGYSPGWSEVLPTRAAELGRLLQLWGDSQGVPRGSETIHATSLEFTRIADICVLARRSRDNSQRSGAVFAHLLAFRSPDFGLAEALACASGAVPYRDRGQLAADLPNPALPLITFDVPILPTPAHPLTELVAAALIDALDARPQDPRIAVVTDNTDDALAALAAAVQLLPRALTQPMTLSTFEYQVTANSPAITVAMSRLSKLDDRRDRVIVDITGADTGRQNVTPESLALVAELAAATGDGFPVDPRTDTPDGLRHWVEILGLRTARAEELTLEQLARLLTFEQIAVPWFAQHGNRHPLVLRALNSSELHEPLRRAYSSSGIDVYRDLAEVCLFAAAGHIDPAAAANTVGADPLRLLEEVRTLFLDELHRGTQFRDAHYELVLPRAGEHLSPQTVQELAQSPTLRYYSPHASAEFTIEALRAELASDRPETGLLADLVRDRRTEVDRAVYELASGIAPRAAVELLRRGFGDHATLQLLTGIADADNTLLIRELLAAADLAPAVRTTALVENWPDILDWLPLEPVWNAAMREVLVVENTWYRQYPDIAVHASDRSEPGTNDEYTAPSAARAHRNGDDSATWPVTSRPWWKFWHREPKEQPSQETKNA